MLFPFEFFNNKTVLICDNVWIKVRFSGGTVDIAIHRSLGSSMIEEVAMASGGAWGGTYVDRQLLSMFERIIGKEEFDEYITKFPSDYFNICKSLELGKRNFSTSSRYFICEIPLSLNQECRRAKRCSLNELIHQSDFKRNLTYKEDKLYLDVTLMKDLFSCVCDGIVKCIQKLLNSQNKTKTILMVGGFSESPYLQETMKNAFPDHEIMIPHDAWLSVLKGAVLYGHNPKLMHSRISKCSYGVDTFVPFNRDLHPPKRLRLVNGAEYCSRVFSKHVTMNEELKADVDLDQKIYRPVDQSHKTTRFDLYTSTIENPEYVDDKECKRLASINVKIPEKANGIKFRFTSVETELKVEISDELTGNIIDVNLDYFEEISESKHSCDITRDK